MKSYIPVNRLAALRIEGNVIINSLGFVSVRQILIVAGLCLLSNYV